MVRFRPVAFSRIEPWSWPIEPPPRNWNRSERRVPTLALFPCGVLLALLAATGVVQAAEQPTNSHPTHLLLTDRFGKARAFSTNEVSSALHPPAGISLRRQIPTGPKGAPQPQDVRERILESKAPREWFSPTPPMLKPYLANLDEYGNTAIQPGAVFAVEPLSQAAQAAKYAISEAGLRYYFYQSLAMVSMTDVASGASALQYYTASFYGKWAIIERTNAG